MLQIDVKVGRNSKCSLMEQTNKINCFLLTTVFYREETINLILYAKKKFIFF